MKQDDWQVVGRDVQGLDRKECQHLIFVSTRQDGV